MIQVGPIFLKRRFLRTVGHKSHDPCIQVFLMEARVMTFVAHCTVCKFESAEKLSHSLMLQVMDQSSATSPEKSWGTRRKLNVARNVSSAIRNKIMIAA